jgi:SAM-dependent methyltransferase
MPSVPAATLKSMDIPIPPKDIRYRIVSSHIDEGFFLESGRNCAGDILKALDASGIDAHGFSDILDFGCGCSRVLRYLIPFLSQAQFSGCDIDDVAIQWSLKNVPGVGFTVVPHLPPTTFPAGSFDFIYGLSVFSHLDLPRQILWLAELHRMLRPGGTLLLTVQGEVAYDAVKANMITKKQEDDFAATGFLFVDNISDKILPDWYQTAIYKEHFARLVFCSGFEVLRYDVRGMTGWQDLLLLRKK